MNEIRQPGRELIEAARREQTPSIRDRERVFAALMASAALSTATASAAAAPSLLAKLGGGLGKWWLLGGLCSVVAGSAYLASGATAPGTAPAQVQSAMPQAMAPLGAPATLPPATPAAPAASVPTPSNLPRGAPAKSASVGANLELELSELHAAYAAYRNARPDQALSLVAQHKRRFPKSQLGVERATLEVLSLCGLGRQRQAQLLADQLRSKARNAAALSGLEGSCVAAPTK